MARVRSLLSSSTVLTLSLLTSFGSASNSNTCYWPNGDTTSSNQQYYLPCRNTTFSNCCAGGDACLANNLCFSTSIGVAYRGACTDQSWNDSEACPNYCANTNPDASANFFSTGDTRYCEWQGQGKFGSVTSTINAWPTPGSVITMLPTSGASNAAAATANPTGSGAVSAGGDAVPTGSPTTSVAVATVTAQSSHSSNNAAAIGAGIGVPLGLLALGLLGFLFWRHKTNMTKASRDNEQQHQQQHQNWPQDQNQHGQSNGYWDVTKKPSTPTMLGHGQQQQEMPVGAQMSEMPNGNFTQELDGRARYQKR